MNIWGKSKAIHSTWFFLDEYKLLLDCGEGASTTLGIHTSDISYIFISHTHLDHISGLVTVGRFQKRTLKREPNRSMCKVIYHKDCREKMHHVRDFLEKFHVKLEFIELEEGQDFEIKKNVFLRPFKVNHSADYYRFKFTAIGCHIIERRSRLKPAFQKEKDKIDKKFKDTKKAHQAFTEFIVKKKKELGKDGIIEEYEYKVLSYCGDSKPVPAKELKGTQILMHEATFIDRGDMDAAHSCVEDVVKLANKVNPKMVIIYHLSERYKRELPKYKQEIMKIAKDKKLVCPLHVVGIDEFFRLKVDLNKL